MHPAMVAEIAADQIRDMRVTAARDQRARLARQGRAGRAPGRCRPCRCEPGRDRAGP